MGLFSRTQKSNTVPVNTPQESSTKRLLLHIGPGGWESIFLESNGTPRGEPLSWEAVSLLETGYTRISTIIKNAVSTLSTQLQEANQISLLIDGIGVLFTDNKPKILNTASPPTARQYGQQLLNKQEVTFGHAEFQPVSGEQKSVKHGIFAFADVHIIRNALALFDKEGIKLREVIPTAFLLIQRATLHPTKAYGGIYMGVYASTLVLFHHDIGSLVVRTIPVGYRTMAEAVAQSSGISVEEALHALRKKNMLADISYDRPTNTLNQSMQSQILAPMVIRLVKEIKDVIGFFTYQRVSGILDELEVFGASDQIHGLTDWLANQLEIPCQTKLPSVLTLFWQVQRPMPCNLLKGSETSLFSVGRNKFYFSEKQGFMKSKDLVTDSSNLLKKSASQRRRTSTNRNSRQTQTSGGLLDRVLTLFHSSPTKGVTAAQELADNDRKQEQAFLTGFVISLCLILYWGYSEFATLDFKYKRAANNYLALHTEINQIDKSLGGGHILRMTGEQTLTKVLWSEKFLALANLISEHIWLTDVYLEKESRKMDEVNIESKKLVVKGGVLPSTDGHIMKIAQYLNDLQADRKQFMSDFRLITFSGSQIEQSESDAIVRFSFESWYDKNVRIENLKNNSNKPQGINEMNKNIDQHNKVLEDSLMPGKLDKRK